MASTARSSTLPLLFACFQAYNAWIADVCRTHPDHLKGVGIIPHGDIPLAVQGLERARRAGLSGGLLAIFPDEDLLYSDARYDALWAAAQSLDMPISLHIGSERRTGFATFTLPNNLVGSGYGYVQRQLAAMVFGGVFERFPTLKIASVENNAGWVPLWMNNMDHTFDRRRNLHQWQMSRELPPSEYIRRQVWFTFLSTDDTWMANRYRIGVDRLMWSSDYPHLESSWPDSGACISKMFHRVPGEEQRKIIAGNAAALYAFA